MDKATKCSLPECSTELSISGNESTECRKAKGLSQKELADLFNTSHTTIGKYERDEMTPSIDVAKKISKYLNTTIGYLLGETQDMNVLKDPDMLKRLNDIAVLPENDKNNILYTIDNLLAAAKTRLAYK
jgi:transcriptional regulator with XRE-family HTH domain